LHVTFANLLRPARERRRPFAARTGGRCGAHVSAGLPAEEGGDERYYLDRVHVDELPSRAENSQIALVGLLTSELGTADLLIIPAAATWCAKDDNGEKDVAFPMTLGYSGGAVPDFTPEFPVRRHPCGNTDHQRTLRWRQYTGPGSGCQREGHL